MNLLPLVLFLLISQLSCAPFFPYHMHPPRMGGCHPLDLRTFILLPISPAINNAGTRVGSFLCYLPFSPLFVILFFLLPSTHVWVHSVENFCSGEKGVERGKSSCNVRLKYLHHQSQWVVQFPHFVTEIIFYALRRLL